MAGPTDAAELMGTWRLLGASAWADGVLVDAESYGKDPIGFIHYLPDGRMSVNIAYAGRLSIDGDRAHGPIEQRAAAYATSISYAGRWEHAGDIVTHHIEVSAYPNEVGSVQRRRLAMEGGRAVLTTAEPLIRDGRPQVFRVVWERISDTGWGDE